MEATDLEVLKFFDQGVTLATLGIMFTPERIESLIRNRIKRLENVPAPAAAPGKAKAKDATGKSMGAAIDVVRRVCDSGGTCTVGDIVSHLLPKHNDRSRLLRAISYGVEKGRLEWSVSGLAYTTVRDDVIVSATRRGQELVALVPAGRAYVKGFDR